MTKKEAIEILSHYDKDFFKADIEDSCFGDGSHYITFPTVYDSKAEATRVAKAIKTLIVESQYKL